MNITRIPRFNGSVVTCHEAFYFEHRFVVCRYFYKCTGNTQTHCFCLTIDTTANNVYFYIVLTSCSGKCKWLVNFGLKKVNWKKFVHLAFVDRDFTLSFG